MSASEPSDEQLENLSIAMGFPVLPPRLRPPYWRESMMNLHALLQRTIDGDEEAAERVAALRVMFAGEEPRAS